MTGVDAPVEVAWFAALCDDDYEYLGVRDPALASSWAHCAGIVRRADALGFDNCLLPSGYELGIDATAFAAAAARETSRMRLLLAVRLGELVVPQLARQLATLDELAGGRLTVNAISSEMPGERLDGPARYRRTAEWVWALRELLAGRPVDVDGEHLRLRVDPPRICRETPRHLPVYFGGLSEEARECAARIADVYLMWPDVPARVAEVVADVRRRAAAHGRTIEFGWRSHVIVRATEDEARAAARRLVSRLDDATGAAIRARSLDAASAGVARQRELRDDADAEGYVARHLWTGVGRARSGAGVAIVGDPDQVGGTLRELAHAGVRAFILSGYPHGEECELVARHVLPRLAHAPLATPPSPAAPPAGLRGAGRP